MTPASTPLAQALAKLRILRGGGHPWTQTEVENGLSAAGFDRIEPFTPSPPILFVLGRRPGT
jgi:hypothetical protein